MVITRNYHSMLHNIPLECRYHLHCGGSLNCANINILEAARSSTAKTPYLLDNMHHNPESMLWQPQISHNFVFHHHCHCHHNHTIIFIHINMAQKYVPSLPFEEAKHTVLFGTCITSSNISDLGTAQIL